jgi:hypothetical protein
MYEVAVAVSPPLAISAGKTIVILFGTHVLVDARIVHHVSYVKV